MNNTHTFPVAQFVLYSVVLVRVHKLHILNVFPQALNLYRIKNAVNKSDGDVEQNLPVTRLCSA